MREGDKKNVQRIVDRIQRGTDMYQSLISQIGERVGGDWVEAKRRYFRDYGCPHSLLIVDDRVVYVSFYDWYHERGTNAPTLRLENGPWAQLYLREANKIDEFFSIGADQPTK